MVYKQNSTQKSIKYDCMYVKHLHFTLNVNVHPFIVYGLEQFVLSSNSLHFYLFAYIEIYPPFKRNNSESRKFGFPQQTFIWQNKAYFSNQKSEICKNNYWNFKTKTHFFVKMSGMFPFNMFVVVVLTVCFCFDTFPCSLL